MYMYFLLILYIALYKNYYRHTYFYKIKYLYILTNIAVRLTLFKYFTKWYGGKKYSKTYSKVKQI